MLWALAALKHPEEPTPTRAASWNVRDRHMAETLERLLDHHGPRVRAIVWAHNTHIGDARFTDMAEQGEVNLGQLARERYGEERVVLVGCGTHRGTVIAAREWDAPMERMRVPIGRPESWEDVLHDAGGHDRLLILDPERLPQDALIWRGHRAIGVGDTDRRSALRTPEPRSTSRTWTRGGYTRSGSHCSAP